MFANVLKEHKRRQAEHLKESAAASRKVERAAEDFSNAVAVSLNYGVVEAFANQKHVEKEVRDLKVQTKAFKQQTAKWAALVKNIDKVLREVGDIENALEVVEKDCSTIADVFEAVVARQEASEAVQALGPSASTLASSLTSTERADSTSGAN